MTAPDHELLQSYAHQRSEAAFAALVARHINLVHSAALRQVRGAHLAEEVAQQVFVELARHAAHMKPDTLLAAWLHAVTRRRAIDVVRAETRRQQREQTALDLAEANSSATNSPGSSSLAPAAAEWRHVAPLLDEALQSLAAPERDAVLLRFFENKSLREVGQMLGISDDAAQKRVHRALDRLRAHFVKRRIPLGAAGLATLLSTQAVQAAPAGLAATLSTTALLSVGAGAGVGLAAAVTKTIAMTTLQKSLVASTLVLSLGFGVYEVRQTTRLQDRLATIEQSAAQARLAHERRLADLNAELTRLRAETERLRAAALATSRAQADDVAAAHDPELRTMADWIERVRTLKTRIKTHPEAAIPEMQWLRNEDWLAATKDNPLVDEADFRRASAHLRSLVETKFAEKAFNALLNFPRANEGNFPADIAQLAPHFFPPVDPAILQRWAVKPAKDLPSLDVGGDWLITQKSLIDEALDQRTAIGAKRFRSSGTQVDPNAILYPVVNAYAAANPTRPPANLKDLLPYATTPEQQAALRKRIDHPLPGATPLWFTD